MCTLCVCVACSTFGTSLCVCTHARTCVCVCVCACPRLMLLHASALKCALCACSLSFLLCRVHAHMHPPPHTHTHTRTCRQWTSFGMSASTSIYVFLYSIHYFVYKTKMTGVCACVQVRVCLREESDAHTCIWSGLGMLHMVRSGVPMHVLHHACSTELSIARLC